ncbi:DUF2752 domain-containing protein [Flammeovirgaceae bacterium SG7u.111]|nr:DUF2752 domain-containing protein [Flammeovirgaceae bacterium SG7u.132]WPO34458.1 DUF2752 domain-containing protein [Flammeovirgaceae bacterium SG7u.111]
MRLIDIVETDFFRSIPVLGWSCGFKNLTGIPCPLCGMTRSCLSTLSLNFGDAFAYHPLGPFICALILAMLASYFLKPRLYSLLQRFLSKNILPLLLVLWVVNLVVKM